MNQRLKQYPALSENDDLLTEILQAENLKLAWKQVRASKGAPGVDNVTVDEFPIINREEWDSIPNL